VQDWFETAQDCLTRASQLRSPLRVRVRVNDGSVIMTERPVPEQRLTQLIGVEVTNAIDASIIGAAQAEAATTGRREAFILPDGATGSVDAEGELYDERPPQG
jgi:hypothetical protein